MRSVRGSMRIRVDRGVSTSVRRGRVGGGKHVAVNFPLTLFTAEDEQLVVCLPRYLMSCEDFLLSGRSSTPVSQVAHLHDFVDRENDAQQPNVCLSVVAMSELVVYRAREFPEYHQWVSKILRVSQSRLMIIQECADVLSVVATVESGRGVAVVGEFITAVAGDRVRFVPFASGAHFQEVGLLYRQSGLDENIRKLVAASLPVKQTTKVMRAT